jgi:hypothetical protein
MNTRALTYIPRIEKPEESKIRQNLQSSVGFAVVLAFVSSEVHI